MIVSQEVKDLAKNMLERPKDWHQDYYYFQNKNHPDIQIWTANGILFIALRNSSCFNIFEKIYIKRAINKSVKKSAIERLSEARALLEKK